MQNDDKLFEWEAKWTTAVPWTSSIETVSIEVVFSVSEADCKGFVPGEMEETSSDFGNNDCSTSHQNSPWKIAIAEQGGALGDMSSLGISWVGSSFLTALGDMLNENAIPYKIVKRKAKLESVFISQEMVLNEQQMTNKIYILDKIEYKGGDHGSTFQEM